MRRVGFTLIELMIVIAIIAIIVVIAVPSLHESRKSAIETAVIQTLRAMVTANEQYRLRYGVYADPINVLVVEHLPQLKAGNTVLENYDQNYQTNGRSWMMPVWPVQPGVTGDRSFYVDSSGVIRVSASGVATSSSPPLK